MYTHSFKISPHSPPDFGLHTTKLYFRVNTLSKFVIIKNNFIFIKSDKKFLEVEDFKKILLFFFLPDKFKLAVKKNKIYYLVFEI